MRVLSSRKRPKPRVSQIEVDEEVRRRTLEISKLCAQRFDGRRVSLTAPPPLEVALKTVAAFSDANHG